MLYLFLLVLIIAIFFFTRNLLLKREVRKVREQLEKYNHQSTNKKVDIALFDQNIEMLAKEINLLIDFHGQEKRERIRFENELKQTVANMSHDLRTPLTSILGYIQLAQANDVTVQEQKEYLSLAKKRAKNLETLLQDFFELTVIESTDYQLESQKINIKNVTIDILMSFYDRFKEKNWEPILHVPENDVFIFSDKTAVTRVIENLISNALKHSDGNINVTLESIDSTVRLTIRNNVHSLTEQDVDRIFDRFYMADQSRSGKGTGLGLSIVKSFMDKMNGIIKASLNNRQLSIICEWKSNIDGG